MCPDISPLTDRFFINQENAPDLSIAVALRDENQGVVTLPFW